jgi:N-acetylglutamate synthase-like GNAT family acetyltransferase
MRENVRRMLEDGLLLRRATVDDVEALVDFQANAHRDPGIVEPDESVGAWTRDLVTGGHPTFRTEDFTIVEDSRSGNIVSSLCLTSQTWSYAGVLLGVGVPELVGTHPDYRRRGLVRAQLEVAHKWGVRRGQAVQAIAGIPWFYRQFGYEMALELDGERAGFSPQVPRLSATDTEPYHIRAATEVDLPFITQTSQQETERYLVARVRDSLEWHYELVGKSELNINRLELKVIESPSGERVGFFAHSAHLRRNRVEVEHFELSPGVSWFTVTPAVIRHLWSTGEQWCAQDTMKSMEAFAFRLGSRHPVYEAARSRLPAVRPAYAWYLRVADVPGFMALMAPVVEQRLESSAFAGYSGELKISDYRTGVRLRFDRGILAEAVSWKATEVDPPGAAFPDLTFLQLLFGYRALEELEQVFADCRVRSDETRALLQVLLPKLPSHVSPVS